MHDNILSITEINDYIKGVLDSDRLLSGVAVRGEISNYKLYPSGHHYFTLKDDGAALKCVMFKGNAFRLRFRPQNGMKVIAFGKIGVFPRDGAYQLYCNSLAVDGVGDLHAAFEQLKQKLSSLGLFDPAHKKPIPKYPGVIGIITSSAGAALHDILRILKTRYPIAKVRLIPTRVQGEEAPGEIASAIAYANAHSLADVLIVGRGGGSLEDLWAFNDEQVAMAIYRSQIPVISAVGHEPDVTIADYVADLRAATPSNAAELAVPDQDNLRQYLDQMSASMAASLNKQIREGESRFQILSSANVLKDPLAMAEIRKQKLSDLKDRMTNHIHITLDRSRYKLAGIASSLDAMSPLKVIGRGYSLTTDDSGNIVRDTKDVKVGDSVHIMLSNGNIHATVMELEEVANESN